MDRRECLKSLGLVTASAALALESGTVYLSGFKENHYTKSTYSAVINAQADPFGPLLRKG